MADHGQQALQRDRTSAPHAHTRGADLRLSIVAFLADGNLSPSRSNAIASPVLRLAGVYDRRRGLVDHHANKVYPRTLRSRLNDRYQNAQIRHHPTCSVIDLDTNYPRRRRDPLLFLFRRRCFGPRSSEVEPEHPHAALPVAVLHRRLELPRQRRPLGCPGKIISRTRHNECGV